VGLISDGIPFGRDLKTMIPFSDDFALDFHSPSSQILLRTYELKQTVHH